MTYWSFRGLEWLSRRRWNSVIEAFFYAWNTWFGTHVFFTRSAHKKYICSEKSMHEYIEYTSDSTYDKKVSWENTPPPLVIPKDKNNKNRWYLLEYTYICLRYLWKLLHIDGRSIRIKRLVIKIAKVMFQRAPWANALSIFSYLDDFFK